MAISVIYESSTKKSQSCRQMPSSTSRKAPLTKERKRSCSTRACCTNRWTRLEALPAVPRSWTKIMQLPKRIWIIKMTNTAKKAVIPNSKTIKECQAWTSTTPPKEALQLRKIHHRRICRIWMLPEMGHLVQMEAIWLPIHLWIHILVFWNNNWLAVQLICLKHNTILPSKVIKCTLAVQHKRFLLYQGVKIREWSFKKEHTYLEEPLAPPAIP